jgi:Tol biopolymer transport system component
LDASHPFLTLNVLDSIEKGELVTVPLANIHRFQHYTMRFTKLLMTAVIIMGGSLIAHAQIRNVEKVAGGLGQYFMNPVWSPDGNFIAMSGNNNNSIHVLHLQTGEMSLLVEADRSGYGFSWSADSRHILYRHSVTSDRIVQHAPAIVDLDGRQPRIVGEASIRMPALPVWSHDASTIYTSDGQRLSSVPSDVVLDAAKLTSTLPNHALLNQGSALMLLGGDGERRMDPIPGSEYINAALSPDGARVVFEVLGGGMYIMDIASGSITDLGSGNRPVWSPAGDRIAFMVAEDDGYTYTSSDIYLINADGSGRRKLSTTPSRMEMNPRRSPDGTRIVFDVYATGDIYIITIDPS